MDFLNEPVKVWHLIVAVIVVVLPLSNIQNQLSAIGKSVWRLIDRVEGRSPEDHDTDI